MPPRIPVAPSDPCVDFSADDNDRTGSEADADEWLQSLSDRLDRQSTLLQEILARVGDTGSASLAQRDDRLYKLLEYSASHIADVGGGGQQHATSMWKPKLTGAGMELRTMPRKLPTPRGFEASPRSAHSDPAAADQHTPHLAHAFAKIGQTGSASRSMGSESLATSTPGTMKSRAAKLRSQMSAIIGGSPRLRHVDEAAVMDRSSDSAGDGADQPGRLEKSVTRETGETAMWSFRRRMWQFVEDRQSSRGARIYGVSSMLAILLCVGLSMTDILFPGQGFPSHMLLAVEAPFMIELIFRFWVCPNRDMFWLDPYNIVDLFAISASVVPRVVVAISVVDEQVAYSCRIFSPFLFLLRFLRRFEHFQLLASAFWAAAEALPVLLYTCFLIALFYASAIFLAETRDVFPTMRDSLWFTIVTMSTVGYGDMSPESEVGRLLTSSLIVLASLYTAIPIGIVGHTFSQVWEERERLLLLQQLRRRIARAGHTPRDLEKMFDAFDEDGNGQLSFDEFKALLPIMRINMPDTVAFRVFETFDDDGAGSLNLQEFLMGIFPAQGFMTTLRSRRSYVSEGIDN
mmetsp:Transcript_41469/g.119560  ORF Transcript_41469/g.119560 Transcript_41469/m.119560 type:complete len:574 (-) Transcript_41469:348-2069(-)